MPIADYAKELLSHTCHKYILPGNTHFQVKHEGIQDFLILTLLLGDFGIPPNPVKELSAAYTTPMLAMKLNVLLHGSLNIFMLIVV